MHHAVLYDGSYRKIHIPGDKPSAFSVVRCECYCFNGINYRIGIGGSDGFKACFIGTFSNTNAQAAPLGSALVVILAVIGGIFFPDYLMPEAIKKISIVSPLKWGTNAFFNIFARGADLRIVYPQILSLISFFMLSIFISATSFAKRK